MNIHSETEVWRRLKELEDRVARLDGRSTVVAPEMLPLTDEEWHEELVAEFEADLKLRTQRFAALSEVLDKDDG